MILRIGSYNCHSKAHLVHYIVFYLSGFLIYEEEVGDLDLALGVTLPSLPAVGNFDLDICPGAICSCNFRDLESIFVLDLDLFLSRNPKP